MKKDSIFKSLGEEGKSNPSFFGNNIFWIFLFILFVAATAFFFIPKNNFSANLGCNDGTAPGNCSKIQPYYCSNGKIVERSSECGCPKGFTEKGNSCFSPYQNETKNVTLTYFIDGKKHSVNYLTYGGVNKYVSGIPRIIEYNGNNTPDRTDFKLKSINEETQREFVLPLVMHIKSATSSKEEQARIAASIVQNIPYGFSNESVKFLKSDVNYSRYPYEVLYDNEGVCSEKSLLLAFLLKELGFETVIFYNHQENHESVGIKCPLEKSWKNTGYCFIETSGPAIISDSSIIYTGGVQIKTMPIVLEISEGISLPEDSEVYDDANDFAKLRVKASSNNGNLNYFESIKFNSLKKKYGLDGGEFRLV